MRTQSCDARFIAPRAHAMPASRPSSESWVVRCPAAVGLISGVLPCSCCFASDSRSQALVESMLGQALGPSPHSSSTVAALSEAVSRPDWQCLEDVDVPLHQHSLSAAIDETLYQHPPPVPVPWPSHLPCLMLVTGSVVSHLPC